MKRLVLTAICYWRLAFGYWLLAIGFWVLAISNANAAPAFREAMRVMQADGTYITVQQFGDEYHHWTTTTDGVMVVNTGKGYYVADIDNEGRMTASHVLVHEKDQRTADEQALISQQLSRHELFHQRGQAVARRALSISETGGYLPHSGNVRILTILVAYQDLGFTVNEPNTAFDQLLNGDEQVDLGNNNQWNYKSVRQYFETCSKGQFSPQFDIVGPVTLPHDMAYYGGTDSDGSDDKFSDLCKDAIALVKDQGLVEDWTPYDNDADGKAIELVCIIYAGYGQNQNGGNNTIWAKASRQGLKVNDQTTATFFNCSCELFYPSTATNKNGMPLSNYINGTGVFIHEMSHCMGLPDLYATTNSAVANNQGMEAWDIMDYGLYNLGTNDYWAPSPYTAWEQEVMGWTEIEPLTLDAEQDVHHLDISNMVPLIEDGGKAYKIVNENNDCNYIVLENMQKRGMNMRAYGHGLLVYQVNYPREKVNMSDSPNNTVGRPAVAVVPADGLFLNHSLSDDWKKGMASSVFPGTENITELNDDMALPNYVFHDTKGKDDTRPIGLSLRGIVENEDGSINFCFNDGTEEPENPDGIENVVNTQHPSPNTWYYDLQGRRIANSQQLTAKGLYIRNGKKVIR